MQFEDNKKPYKKYHRSVSRQTLDGFISHSAPRQPARILTPAARPNFQPVVARGRLIDDVSRPRGQYVSHSAPVRSSQALADNLKTKHVQPLLNSQNPDAGKSSTFSQRNFRRWSLRTSAVMGSAVLIIGGFLLIRGFLQLHNVFKGGGTAAALQGNVDPSQLKGVGDGRVNILLLGIGGPGHDGPDLTDTIMLASVDPVNNKVALISIPRDLWVKEPNNYMSDYGKINAAYESGKYQYLGRSDSSSSNQKAVEAGFKAVDQTVSGVLGVPIHYNVLVDFQAFSKAINTVGGVTLNVPSELYDPTVAWQNNWNPVIAKAGLQTMNGAQALLYSRSRETSTDFARASRQRAVLVALKDKVLSAGTLSNPWKINQLISAFGSNVRTDLSLTDTEALYSILKKVGNNQIQSIGLAGNKSNNLITTGMLYGESVDEPAAGLFNYSQIESYIRNTAKDGYIAKENARITVLNGTTTDGAATRAADMLKSYSFNVKTVADAPSSDYSKTTLLDFTGGQNTSHYLQQLLKVSSKKDGFASQIKPNGANFVIIIGNDEANSNS